MSRYVAGIDIGSVFTKSVIVSDNKILGYYILPSGKNYRLAGERALQENLSDLGLTSRDLEAVAATGYEGPANTFSSFFLTEISCLAKGVRFFFPDVRTAVAMGGRTSVAVSIHEGKPVNFMASEKCAGGTGKFLQIIAKVLQLDMEKIAELSLRSRNPVVFTTSCAVFNESETISRIAEGASKEDIAAGAHEVLVARISSLLERISSTEDCAFVGGAAKDRGLVARLEKRIGKRLYIPEEPLICSAVGAALIGLEKLSA